MICLTRSPVCATLALPMPEIVTIERRVVNATFAWILPVWFVVFSVLGATQPGHGSQLFSIGALPGVWAGFLAMQGGSVWSLLLPTLIAGTPLLWFLGRLLDRLDADLWLWIAALLLGAGATGYFLLQGYADLEAALEHHGGFPGYAYCAMQLGSYAATLLLLVIRAGSSRR